MSIEREPQLTKRAAHLADFVAFEAVAVSILDHRENSGIHDGHE
jgi:hypothetical protein